MSSRCWASSSTISASRAGVSLRPDNRLLTSSFQSGMFDSGNTINGFDKLLPTVTLRRQNLLAFGSETVIATSSLSCFLYPATLNPTSLLESIEQRVKRGDVES